MDNERRECGWVECDIIFTPVTSNQIYHNANCQRLAMNAKNMQRYYRKKERQGGAHRICAGAGCSTVLSRYNDNESLYCSKCEKIYNSDDKESKKFLESLFGEGNWEYL